MTVVTTLLGTGGGIGGLALWYVKDRRKSQAESAVAVRTVESSVDLRDQDAHDARLLYVQRQVDMERAFHQQQLADRDAEIIRQREELTRRDERIASLRDQVSQLEKQLADVHQQLDSVRAQLSDLADHVDPDETLRKG
jgi:septal ring factor EnvC (AmiA/AmiB activator)